MRRGGAAVEECSRGRVKSLLHLLLRNEQSSLRERVCCLSPGSSCLSPGFPHLRSVCKKERKNKEKKSRAAAVAHIFNYNALLLKSQGRIEESIKRLLASGASFIFFFQAKQQKFHFELVQMRPQPVPADL